MSTPGLLDKRSAIRAGDRVKEMRSYYATHCPSKIESNTRMASGASIVIDGRAANLSRGTVEQAMKNVMSSSQYDKTAPTVTVYTAQGKLVYSYQK